MDNNADVLRGRQPLTLDGIRPASEGPVQPRLAAPPVRRMQFRAQPARRKTASLQKLQLPLLAVACATAGFFADNLFLGLALIAGYGIFALFTRVPSHTTFTLALLLLATISLLLLFKPDSALTQNFATYTFVLFLIGVLTLAREAKQPKRIRRKYRR